MIVFNNLPDCPHIIRTPDKGCRNIIISHPDAKKYVVPVYITDIRHGQNCSWHINPLMVRHITAINDFTDNIRVLYRLDCKFN